MSKVYREPSIDASYQVSDHLACGFRGKDFQKQTNQKKELPVAPCLYMDRDKISTLLQRTSHRCLLPSVRSFGQAVSEEKVFFKLAYQKQELPVVAIFVNGLGQNEQSLQRTFHSCFLPNFSSFGKAVSEKIFQKSTNQKQEWPVAAMFVYGSELNEQCLQRTFQVFFLPRFDSFGQAVSEENLFLEINQSETRMACGSHVC